MIGEYESLKKVLSTIEAKEDLNKDNIINDESDIFLPRKQTLLIIAAQNGYTKTVGVLLEAGADVNEKDLLNRTVLHYAALCGHKEIVEFLISKEADVNAEDVLNHTALHHAALYGCKAYYYP